MSNSFHFIVPVSSKINSTVSRDSGAFNIDRNPATIAGYATLAGGTVLAGAIGTMVAPLPTIGLSTVGAGLIVAGNFDDIKAHFASKKDEADTEVKSETATA